MLAVVVYGTGSVRLEAGSRVISEFGDCIHRTVVQQCTTLSVLGIHWRCQLFILCFTNMAKEVINLIDTNTFRSDKKTFLAFF